MNQELESELRQAHDALLEASERLENLLAKLEAGDRWELDDEDRGSVLGSVDEMEDRADTCMRMMDKVRALLTGREEEVIR